MEKQKIEISIILPSRNEGESVRKVVEELYQQLEQLGRTFEVIAIDSPSGNDSYGVYKEYAQKYDNFTAISLAENRPAGSGKSVQYMIGFKLAKGEYIIHLDSDGQDNPADLPKFIEKLDEGYELVVGHKQNRKDGKVYMLTSKVSNALTRWITGTNVQDMNCGFKGYRAYAARTLNLKGRWYRFIPSILQGKGFKVTEVPIENRKREWGSSNFSFFNRLQGGLFDMLIVALLNRTGDTPFYFFGWCAILFEIAGWIAFILLFLTDSITWKIFSAAILGSTLTLVGIFIGIGVGVEYLRAANRNSLESYNIREIEGHLAE